jgi:hypothetical protein
VVALSSCLPSRSKKSLDEDDVAATEAPAPTAVISAPNSFKHAVKVTFNEEFSRWVHSPSTRLLSSELHFFGFRFEGLPPEWSYQNQQFGVPLQVCLLLLLLTLSLDPSAHVLIATSKEDGSRILSRVRNHHSLMELSKRLLHALSLLLVLLL